MKSKELSSSLLLLLTALIWGLAFIAQREGAKLLDSFTFNGIRFGLGALSLVPVMLIMKAIKKRDIDASVAKQASTASSGKALFIGSLSCGAVLFVAVSLQQLGMSDTSFGAATTAGKAAFITGFYIPLVPIAGILLGHKIAWPAWIGVVLAMLGLYFLSITSDFKIQNSDLLILISAVFWTVHILLIDYFSRRVDGIYLSCLQFAVCSIISLVLAFTIEEPRWDAIVSAAFPIFFGGVVSVGIAYTLQVIGQKHLKPSPTTLLLSLETVFASIGGFIILGEIMSGRAIVGSILMLVGIAVSQFKRQKTSLS